MPGPFDDILAEYGVGEPVAGGVIQGANAAPPPPPSAAPEVSPFGDILADYGIDAEILDLDEADKQGNLSRLGTAAEIGHERFKQAMYAFAPSFTGADAGFFAKQVARQEAEIMKYRPSPGLQKFLESEGFSDAMKNLAANPFEVISGLTAESLGEFAPVLGAAAVSGPLAPATVGAGSFSIEAAHKIMESFREEGIDLTDAAQVEEAFRNPELMARVRVLATKKAVPIAAVDALSMGIIGRVAKVGRRLAKPFTGAGRINKVSGVGSEVVAQGGLGGLGDFLGQVSAGEEISATSIIAEVVAEIGTSPVEFGAAAISRRGAAPTTTEEPPTEPLEDGLEDAPAPADATEPELAPAAPAAEAQPEPATAPTGEKPTKAQQARLKKILPSDSWDIIPLLDRDDANQWLETLTKGAEEFETSQAAAETTVAIQEAEAATETEPSEAQKAAGNYAKGKVTIQGLPITIETPKGETRRGKDADGRPWEVVMPATYGYIRRSEGADGEQVDVYIGDNPNNETVFIVDQLSADTGKFDEQKIFVGFESEDQARATYELSFDDGRAQARLGGITETDVDGLKQWLQRGDTTKEFGDAQREPRSDDKPPDQVVQDLAEYEGPLPQPEEPALPQLRRQGDIGLPAVGEELSGVQEGDRGTTGPEVHAGPDRQQRPLRTGQRPLADQEAAGPEHAQEPITDLQGQDADVDGLGRGDRTGPVDAPVPPETGRDDRGASIVDQEARRSSTSPESIKEARRAGWKIERVGQSTTGKARNVRFNVIEPDGTKHFTIVSFPKDDPLSGSQINAKAYTDVSGRIRAKSAKAAPKTEPESEKPKGKRASSKELPHVKPAEKPKASVTPRARPVSDRTDELRAEASGIVSDLTGGRADVTFATEIWATGEGLKLSGAVTGERQEIAGLYSPLEDLIEISLSEKFGPTETASHEVWHYLREHGFFTPEELSLLERERSRLADVVSRVMPDANVAAMTQEELEAVAFSEYHARTFAGQRVSGVIPGVRRAFQRVVELFRRLATLARGRGYEDVFRATAKGEVAERGPVGMERQSTESSASVTTPYVKQANRVKGTAEQEAVMSRIMATPDNRSLGVKFRERIDAIKNTNLLRFKQGFLDQFASIEAAEKAVSGKVRDARRSAYKAALRTQNLESVMAAVFKFGALQYDKKNGVFEIKPESKGFEEIFRPIADAGLMNLWKHWAIAKRAKRLKAEGRENWLTNDDISLLQNLDKEHLVDGENIFQQTLDDWIVFNSAMLDMAQEAGIVSAEQRALWANHDYVPFYRVLDDILAGPQKAGGLSGQTSGIRRLTGGEAPIGDLIENMILNTTKLVDASFKNIAMQRTVAMLANTGVLTKESLDWKVAHVQTSSAIKALKDVGVDIERLPDGQQEKWLKLFQMVRPRDPDIVSVMVNGKPEYYRVHDPLLLRSLTSLHYSQVEGMMKLMRGAKRLLTRFITVDPAFMIANAMRDTLQAKIVLGKNAPRLLRGDPLRGFLKSLREDTSLVAIMAAGGGSGGFYRTAPDDVRKLIDKRIRQVDRSTIIDAPKKAWELWQRIGAASENANRIAVYEQVIRNGGTKAEAVQQAQDLLNFSMRGDFAAMRFLTETVPFMNARMQGLYRLYRGARDNRKTFLIRGSVLMGASLALLAANWDNDEYKKLPEWDKDTYYHIFIDGRHFRIPKPFEVGALFSTVPERFTTMAFGDDDKGLFAKRIKTMFLETFALNPTPQLFAPIIEQVANRNFFLDRPIVGLSNQRLPAEAQATSRTSTTAKLAGRLVPSALGPAGSPVRIDHMVNGYFGTLGRYLVGATDALIGVFDNAPPEAERRLDQIPIIQRFYRQEPAFSTKYATEFYDLKREADAVASAIREFRIMGDLERSRKYADKNPGLLKVRPALSRMNTILGRLNQMRRSIEAHRSMDPEEKRMRLDALVVKRNEILSRIVPLKDRYGL